MNKQYTYIENQYPARPRSKRRREMGEGISSNGSTTVVTGGSDGGTSGVTSHSQLSGIVSTADEYSEFAKDIHLAASDADALKKLSSLEIIESTDEETIPTDSNLYSALKSKLEDEKKALEMENKYIRKDKPDETDYRVDFHDGITAGHYVGGFLGDGAIIDKEGNSEMTSLKLREFLEVPELRFNRVDVVSGELWNAIAFGLIEGVDEVNRIVTLKLEEGELSGMHINDFCRGIFHNLTDNETAPGVDGSGFDVMVGFRTSYFTPVEIIDNAHFQYELKPGTTVHPCKSMKYAVYGNPTDKNRQASAYHTRTYTRYLRGVNTWKIESKHISMQLGDLSNLIINGESLAEGSVYLNNVYFGGNVWYTPEQKESMKGDDAYSVTLSTYSAVYNIADGIYEQADVVSGEKKVVTGANQVVASQFNVSTRLQVSKGAEPLRFSEVVGAGKYLVTSSGTNCTYVITDGMVAVQEVTADKAEIKIEVNCEGIATYEVVFTIVRVADGKDGKDYEYIYTRTATEVKPATPATSQIDDYVPNGWTDDSIGPTLELPFEWVCKRVKRDGVWRDYSIPSLWARFGEDGTDYEYIYIRTTTQSRPSIPPTSQDNDYIPNGWTDDPVGPTSGYPYEWVSKRTKIDSIWGVFSTPALWSKFAEDGTDHEFIYCRTTSYNTPSTPGTSQTDDYVPSGWTDDPAGVSASYPYEWMSKRDKVKSVWGSFSIPSLWAKYGHDGNDGKPGVDGRYTEDRYRRSESQPPVSGNPPSGWSLDPPATGAGPIWVIRAKFNGDGSIIGSWSTPVKWTGSDGKDGNPGSQGIPGTSQYFHVKYSVNSNGNPMSDSPNTYIGTSVTSSSTAPTSYTSYKWVRLAGAQGPQGNQGIPGTPGSDGRTPYLHIKYSDNGTSFTGNGGETAGTWIGQYVDFTETDSTVFSRYTWTKIKGETGPAITYRGVYSSLKQYVGNATRVDVVKHSDYWYIAKTTAGAFTGQTPSTTSNYWERLQGQFESIATGLLIADQANIAGWRFRENYIESQNSNVVLNGNADNTPKIALGASYVNRDSAPTRFYEDGRIYSKKFFAEDGCYIGAYKIENNWLTGITTGGADDSSSMMQLRHTKTSDGSFSKITFGSNINNSIFSNQRVTARIYNGISNKSAAPIPGWNNYYRNTALQLESNYADVNLALETIGGRMHRGRLWEIEEVSPVYGAGTYSLEKNGSLFLFRDLKDDLTFELPSHSTIQSMFGNFQTGVAASTYGVYTIRIFIDRYCAYRVLVVGTSTTPLLNHNGDIQNDVSGANYGARWLSKGDFMVLVFYNKAWYIQSFSN